MVDCIADKRRRNTLISFLELIDSIPLDEKGCKIWPLGINSQGHGNYSISNMTYSVHRLLYTTVYNKNYYGLVVRHKCDNRSCCNIDHLEIGTQSDNMLDASKRKRLRVGKENNQSVLTEKQVIEMRSLYPQKSTIELAELYGIKPSNVRHAIIGQTWGYLPGAKKLLKNKRALGERMGRSKLTERQVLEIREKYPKIKAPQLAKEYKVGHALIYRIIKRKNWKHI